MRLSVITALSVLTLITAGCSAPVDPQAGRGAAAIAHYGCGSCHTVAGIPGANGKVGPPLTGIGSRLYVAGMLENTPANMASWIHDPKAINPKTAMPKLGVTERDAADIAYYLHDQ